MLERTVPATTKTGSIISLCTNILLFTCAMLSVRQRNALYGVAQCGLKNERVK